MSEQTLNNKTLVIGLAVVAVLLAAIVGVLFYQQSSRLPAASSTATPGAAPTGEVPGAPAGMPGGVPGATTAPSEVDPATATKVPEGTEPEAFVASYYEACENGDWQAAFDALPADKKTGNSPEALKEQVSGYGIEGFKIIEATSQGDTSVVKVDQITGQYGTFENTWTFVQKDGEWILASKAVTGMK